MFNRIRRPAETGFTIVELLIGITVLTVLMPVVLLTLSDLLRSATGALGLNVQDTDTKSVLRSINLELAGVYTWNTSLAVATPLGPTNNTSTPETWSYCGINGTSDCSVSTNRVLIAYQNATNKAPTDTTRQPVFANTAGSCDTSQPINIVHYANIYFVAPDTTDPSYNDLYRRTVVNPDGYTVCGGVVPYQTNTCARSVLSNAGCKDASNVSHADAILLTHVISFNVDYYPTPNGTAIANPYTALPGSITSAQAIKISVTTQALINGSLRSNTADVRINSY
ncbi:MAG TPA: prepilin-type N-terminal cleavage/methylation domain-containing protein [Candidatus Bathyarchaeia archaeon]|nr:prepilin-type N-terminal cleavage/methylation domain-containing protein [Candidatus Bathyarchaeia archaeon]